MINTKNNLILFLGIALFTTNAIKPVYIANSDEKMKAYGTFRSNNEQKYLQRFPNETDTDRYKIYLQELYPNYSAETIGQMAKEDIRNADKLQMRLWQIGGADWKYFHNTVTPPPPTSPRPAHANINKYRVPMLVTCVSIPLVIGGTYKIAQLIKKKYQQTKCQKDVTTTS